MIGGYFGGRIDALVMEPSIVVCDEPTSALDVSGQAHILNRLEDLRNRLGLTYVFISHDLAVVDHMADTVAVMYLGHLVEAGRTADIFAAPAHPYTRALLDSALTPDPHLGLPEITLGRGLPNPLAPPSGCTFHPRCRDCLDVCRIEPPALAPRHRRRVACHLEAPPG